MVRSDPTTADTEQPVSCPLCEFTPGEQADIYQHLMVSHRKSELSRAVLSLLETSRVEPQEGEQPEFNDAELHSENPLL